MSSFDAFLKLKMLIQIHNKPMRIVMMSYPTNETTNLSRIADNPLSVTICMCSFLWIDMKSAIKKEKDFHRIYYYLHRNLHTDMQAMSIGFFVFPCLSCMYWQFKAEGAYRVNIWVGWRDMAETVRHLKYSSIIFLFFLWRS